MTTLDDVLRTESPEHIEALLDDADVVFLVDWRELDDAIAELCNHCLHASHPGAPELTAELVDVGGDGEPGLYHRFGTRRARVPLAGAPSDRHATLVAIHAILAPEYELRMCTDSLASDTIGFVALSAERWRELEGEHGEAVGRLFHLLDPADDPFAGEPAPAAAQPVPVAARVSKKPWWAFWR